MNYELGTTIIDELKICYIAEFAIIEELKTVDYGATNGCAPMHICYRGSQEEWAAIDISSNSNSALLDNTNITFNYQAD